MQKHAVQRSPRLPIVVISSIHFPAITRGCIPASIRRTPTDKERTEYTRRHQLAKWLNIFDLPMFGAETLWRVTRALAETMQSREKWCIPGQRFPFLLSISPPSPRAGAAPRGLFVFLPPSLQFRSAVPAPPTPSLTGSGVRQAFTPRNDYFLLPPSLLPLPHDEPKNPHSTPSVGCWHIWLSVR